MIIIEIFAVIVSYFVVQYIILRYMIPPENPPNPVRVAGIMEVAFGTIVLGSGVYLYDPKDIFAGIFCMLLGLFWIGVAVSLYNASKVGRTICLVLSILRIPTIIGAFFSALTLYKLYVPQESKDFFDKAKKEKQRNIKEN